jgi:hypothetical protein
VQVFSIVSLRHVWELNEGGRGFGERKDERELEGMPLGFAFGQDRRKISTTNIFFDLRVIQRCENDYSSYTQNYQCLLLG